MTLQIWRLKVSVPSVGSVAYNHKYKLEVLIISGKEGTKTSSSNSVKEMSQSNFIELLKSNLKTNKTQPKSTIKESRVEATASGVKKWAVLTDDYSTLDDAEVNQATAE